MTLILHIGLMVLQCFSTGERLITIERVVPDEVPGTKERD